MSKLLSGFGLSTEKTELMVIRIFGSNSLLQDKKPEFELPDVIARYKYSKCLLTWMGRISNFVLVQRCLWVNVLTKLSGSQSWGAVDIKSPVSIKHLCRRRKCGAIAKICFNIEISRRHTWAFILEKVHFNQQLKTNKRVSHFGTVNSIKYGPAQLNKHPA